MKYLIVIITILFCAGCTFDVAHPQAPSDVHKLGSSIAYGGDLGGSTNTAQYVQSISGNAGGNGTVTMNSNTLKVVTSPFAVQDNGGVTRFSLETTHGRGTFGKGGSDLHVDVGPLVGLETSNAGIYILPNGTAAGSNWAIQGDGANLVFQSISGSINLYPGAAQLLSFNSGTQQTLPLGAFQATSGHIRTPNAWNWYTRNAANSADIQLMYWDGANDLFFGDPSNMNSMFIRSLTTLTISSGAVTIAGGSGSSATIGNTTGTDSLVGSVTVTTRTITGNLTVDTTTTDHDIWVDTTSAAVTVTLPAPTNGRELVIIDSKNNFATHNCTLARHASENIDNVAASKVLSASGERLVVKSDGTNWITY